MMWLIVNFTSVFVDNGHLNWNAINTLCNIILVGSLILVTLLYARQVKKQTGFMKIDRVVKEMEKLVAPMHSKIGDTNIYLKGAPGYKDSHFASVREYFRFWDEVKQNKYLAPSYLRSAIDNYQKNKSNSVGDRTRDASYKKAETELFDAIKRRYSELERELSLLREKS